MNYESSLSGLADNLVAETRKIVRQAKTEEELRIGFEKILDPILKTPVRIHSRYERASAKAKTVFRGRPDAVHGQVIIEYESPGSFSSKGNVAHAYQQLTDYLSAESRNSKAAQPVGVGFDGESIFFVQKTNNFVLRGSVSFTASPKNELHQKLAEISKKCHQLKIEGQEKEVERLEKENDGLVEDLFKRVGPTFAKASAGT